MDCRMQHLGIWLAEDRWLSTAVEAVRSGLLVPRAQGIEEPDRDDEVMLGPNGMAIVPIRGMLVKGRSSFGGTSTIDARRMIRQLAANDRVSGIMLFIDSPGGTAAGTMELAEEVTRARESKPVRAHIEDLGASAAYWIASQAESISANRMAQVGSIGTVAVVVDSSAAAEAQGFKVHVISTGPHKGAGAPGVEITRDQLDVFQETIDDMNVLFLSAVSQGRGFSGGQLAVAGTGRTWIADKAKTLGLIDEIKTWEQAVEDFSSALNSDAPDVAFDRRRMLALTELEIELTEGR